MSWGASATHWPALDGLRGIAVAGVLVFHADLLTGGFLGVDCFFVLSGFLITSLLLREADATGTVSLRAFWARRARRLLPALLAVVAAIGLYAALWAQPNELAGIRSDSWATLGYVANWHDIFSGTSYWDQFVAPSPLTHMWSLAIEEQFYLVWPIIVLGVTALRRRAAPRMLAIALGGALVSTVTMAALYRPGFDPQRVYLGTDTRATAILLGAALAALINWRGYLPEGPRRRALELTGVLGAAVLAVAWTKVGGETAALYRGGFLLLELAVVAVIACSVQPSPGPIARVLSARPLRSLGLISYGLYLWHWPVFLVVTSTRTGINGGALITARVGISLVIAVTSYFVLEQPIRHGFLGSWRIGALGGAAATIVTVAVLITTTGAVTPPLVDTAGAAPSASAPVAPSSLELDTAESNSVAPGQTLRILIVGDSLAFSLAESFVRLQDTLHLSVVNAAIPACFLLSGAEATRGQDGREITWSRECTTEWDIAVNTWQPDVVVLLVAGQTLGDWLIDGRWTHLCEDDYDRWYGDQLARGVTTLSATGARVVIAGPPPLLLPSPTINERLACMRTVEQQVASQANVAMIDLTKLVCPHRRCLSEVDGSTLRPDGLHFQGEGADVVTRWLVPQLREIVATPSRSATPSDGLSPQLSSDPGSPRTRRRS